MTAMWCAECGSPMGRRDDGAWHGCCTRAGYWSDASPLPRDSWMPVTQRDGLTFYPSANWPVGRSATAALRGKGG